MATVEAPPAARAKLPAHGHSHAEVSAMLDEIAREDVHDWEAKLMAGGTYPAGADVMEVAKEAYLKFFSTNPLYSSIFKSLAQMEREIVEMTAGLHHGGERHRQRHVGRLGVDPDGRQDRPRPRPRPPSRDQEARDDRAVLGPSGLHEGRPVLRPDGRRGAAARRPRARRRGLQAPDHAQHRAHDRLGAELHPGHGRPRSASSRPSPSSGTSTSTSTRASAAISCRSSRSWATRSPSSTSGSRA